MQLVCLYGPPGVGKLTVGGALASLTGFRLFHNHLTVDLVTSIFRPNTAAWNDLARQIRVDVFTAAARENVDLILTRAPRDAGPAELDRVRTMIVPVQAAGGTVLFVRLVCDPKVLFDRVQSESRRVLGKLTDPEILIGMYDLDTTYPHEPHLTIDVTDLSPAEAAAQIAEQYALPIVSG